MANKRRYLVALLFEAGLEAEINGLRRALGSGQLDRIPPHITLIPPTNVDSSSAPSALRVVVDAAALLGPFELGIGPPSTFVDNASVLFLSVRDDAAVLDTLRPSLFSGPFEHRREAKRPFVAHVTVHSSRDPEDADGVLARLSAFRVATTIGDLALLVQDDHQRSRPWRVVARVNLGTALALERAGTRLQLVTGSAGREWLGEVFESWDLDPAVLGRGQDSFVAAFDGARPVGIATFATHGERAELGVFAVAPSMRALGVGSSLLGYLEAQLRTRAVEVAIARAVAESDSARFFSARGWVELSSLLSTGEGADLLFARRLVA